ncbi:MAG: hypothetical protein CMO42_09160 [Verrucomicrobiales bacterium]|nr:hypothetical protein [Verrucomicrobiales bacterium]
MVFRIKIEIKIFFKFCGVKRGLRCFFAVFFKKIKVQSQITEWQTIKMNKLKSELIDILSIQIP